MTYKDLQKDRRVQTASRLAPLLGVQTKDVLADQARTGWMPKTSAMERKATAQTNPAVLGNSSPSIVSRQKTATLST